MRDELELAELTRTTVDMIASNPEAIVFLRIDRVSDGAGGWIEDARLEVDPQICKIQTISRNAVPLAQSAAGEVARPTHEIVGLPGMNVKPNDTFMRKGFEWRVVHVNDAEDWITKVEVIRGSVDVGQ